MSLMDIIALALVALLCIIFGFIFLGTRNKKPDTVYGKNIPYKVKNGKMETTTNFKPAPVDTSSKINDMCTLLKNYDVPTLK